MAQDEPDTGTRTYRELATGKEFELNPTAETTRLQLERDEIEEVTAEEEDRYRPMTVAELREELHSRGLAVSGSRDELTRRLQRDDDAAR